MATFQEFLEQRQSQTPTQERPVSDFENFLQQKQTGAIPEIPKPQKGFFERQGIIQTILKAPIELGKDIAKLTPEKKELEKSRQRLDFMKKRIEDADLDIRQKQIVGNILDDIPPLVDIEKPKTASQVIGDVLGTALFLAPVGSIIKGGTAVAHLARGGLIGAGFGATESLSEGDDTKDFIKNTILGATIGAPAELAGVAAIKGIGKIASLIGKTIKPFFRNLAEKNPRFLMSIGARLKTDFGDEGKEIAERFLTADRSTLQRVGGTFDDLSDKGLFDLDDATAIKLTDALEGRVQVDDSIRSQFEVVDKLRKEIAEEATKKGVEVRYRGKVPEEVLPTTKELEPLTQEIRKFKSAEKLLKENVFSKNLLEDVKLVNPSDEWAKISFDPNQVKYGGNLSEQSIRRLDKSLQEFRAGDKLTNPAFERIEKLGLERTPIVVESISKKGEISVLDGSHRLTIAREKNIPIEAYIPKSQLTDFNQAVRGVELPKPPIKPSIEPKISGIPKELEPLAAEARKHKNAEEFVKAYKPKRIDEKIIDVNDLTREQMSDLGGVLEERIFKDSNTIPAVDIPKNLFAKIKSFESDPRELRLLFGKERGVSDVAVNKLVEGFRRGDDIPAVYLYKNRFVDGGHRVEAAIKAGKTKIKVFDLDEVIDDTIRLGKEEEYKIVNIKNIADEPAQLTDFYNQAVRGEAKQITTEKLVRPFKPREDFFPHLSPATAKLQTGKIREQVLDNAVRIGKFTNKEDATKALDSYLEFVEKNGKGGEFWINWLVDSGQAQSKDQARGMTLRFFKKSRLNRFGSLEYARELDFPFYDPDPRRVIPIYTMGAVGRLEEITQFGGKFETIDKLIGAIRRKEGIDVGRELATLVKQVRGAIETSPKRERTSLFLRTLQVPKLAFAQILNVGQNLNTLLATDSYTLFRAIPLAFRDEGIRRALQTGSTLESVLREAHRVTGVENQLGEKFLRFVGFTATERFNRTVSANAGVIYAQRTLEKLRKNPEKAIFRVRLREFGIDSDKALQRGITEEELLRAGQIMTELTQFRARPIDLPAFATSPEGKIIFQFKNFAFQQTKFLKNRLKQQVEAGNYGGLLRDFLVISTVFPATGEVIADIRSLVTGQKRPTDVLDRYLDNLMSVGAFGIFADAWQSAKWGGLSDFAFGPTAGTITEAVERVVQAASRQDINKGDIKFLLRQTGFGRTIANYAFPNNKREQETFLQTLIDGFEEF